MSGNTPVENDKFKSLLNIIEITLFNCFRIAVGILFGPQDFPFFRREITFITSVVLVGETKKLLIFGFLRYFVK